MGGCQPKEAMAAALTHIIILEILIGNNLTHVNCIKLSIRIRGNDAREIINNTIIGKAPIINPPRKRSLENALRTTI